MSAEAAHAIGALHAGGVDVDVAARRRDEYSYDASNYRVRPEAVVFPHGVDDVVASVSAAHRNGVAVTARGGGTSMAGNALGHGIIIDLSRHLHAIGEPDVVRREITVEAGAILSDVQRRVEMATEGRYTFAPDPSSRNRATVGGSIANDACGNHSVEHGRMSDHLVSVDLVTADGARLTATDGDLRATDPEDDVSRSRAAIIKAGLRGLRGGLVVDIRDELDRLPRQVSGFHLAHLLPENGFDVAKALAGSEGTCAIVVGATLRIVAKPVSSTLLVVGYRDIVNAAEDVPMILEHRPSAVEGIDEVIVATMRQRRGPRSVVGLPDGDAWLLIEFDGAANHESETRASELAERLLRDGRAIGGRVILDSAERTALWRVREDGAGLSSRLPDGTTSWPGWEDSAVAPENLAGYLRELRALMATHGLTGVMYGHFGAGCIHVRLTFDFATEPGRATFSAFTADAARLVVAHGGSLSGEHGDGRARSALLPLMYSPDAMAAFHSFKRLWDPTGILNPGVIVEPAAVDDDLALAAAPVRVELTTRPQRSLGVLDDAHRCIGVGRCRSHTGGVMCPSYRATGDEKDSTRGRARVLQEMILTAPSERAGWQSEAVHDALDLCLSCKACSSDCPTGVDMASYKSHFLDGHYAGKVRPMSHYSLGWLPRWLKITGLVAPMVNVVLRSPLRGLIARVGGIAPRRILPRFRSANAWRRGLPMTPAREKADVVLFVDTFTRAFRPQVAAAAVRVLDSAGVSAGCESDACCGLTWISTGQLSTARRLLSRAVDLLDDGTERPIVVLEPSCAAALRKDLPELLESEAAKRVSRRVRSFAEQVEVMATGGWTPAASMPASVTVQGHCHEYAVFGADLQRRALSAVGIDSVQEAVGCCGVAGNFGFEAEHFDLSMQVAEQALIPALASTPPAAPVLTDGFSCHMQVRQVEPDRSSLHLAELLDGSANEPRITRSATKGKR